MVKPKFDFPNKAETDKLGRIELNRGEENVTSAIFCTYFLRRYVMIFIIRSNVNTTEGVRSFPAVW